MSSWMTIGVVTSALLLIAFVAVLLERTYDAGFEDGFAKGQEVAQ